MKEDKKKEKQKLTRSEENKTAMKCDNNPNTNSPSSAGFEYSEASLLANIQSKIK